MWEFGMCWNDSGYYTMVSVKNTWQAKCWSNKLVHFKSWNQYSNYDPNIWLTLNSYLTDAVQYKLM
jgi:hypothetical protein